MKKELKQIILRENELGVELCESLVYLWIGIQPFPDIKIFDHSFIMLS
jgi:hypothetical protein